MARKTFYATFSQRLHDLMQYIGEHQESMEALGQFSSADKAALRDLVTALTAARDYFPSYTNVP